MSTNENLVKEYDNLRNEINQKIELHNTLLTFTITTTVAVLSLALSQNSTILYLIPFCILIPMSMRIAYYRAAMSKLSAYMIVFLEKNIDGMKWETRNAEILEIDSKSGMKRAVRFATSRYYECLILTVICYILYLLDYLKDKEISSMVVVNMLWPLLLVGWEFWVTKCINSLDEEKQYWVEQWNKLSNREVQNIEI